MIVWEPFLDPKLHLVSASRRDLRHFGQELTHHAIHNHPETVLWCDGTHGFNPYDFAELNLTRGRQADDGADRVLIKRCMTAFQWDTVLDTHVDEKLNITPASMVLLNPYDALFTHPELSDWEQEDYLRYSLRRTKDVVRKHNTPFLAFVDMDRLWRSHPTLAQMIFEQVETRWVVDRPDGRWRAVEQASGLTIDPYLRRQVTLLDYHREPIQVRRSRRSASMTFTHAATKSATNLSWASS